MTDLIEVSDRSRLPATPVVSVHMLAYRHEQYLGQAIESVIGQQAGFPFELVIGEDCSPDLSRDIALTYQKKYPDVVRVIFSGTNVGAMRNYKRTFEACRGEFIAFCEGDDFWISKDKLQLQVDFLSERPDFGAVHSDIDHVIYNFGRWRRLKGFRRFHGYTVPQGEIFNDLIKSNFVYPCSLLCRRSLMARHINSPMFSLENRIADWALVIHLSQLAKFGYIDQSLAAYRRTPGSAMNAGHVASLKRIKSWQGIFATTRQMFACDPQSMAEAAKAYDRALMIHAFNARDKAVFEEAIAALAQTDRAFLDQAGVRANRKRLIMQCGLLHTAYLQFGELRKELSLMADYDPI